MLLTLLICAGVSTADEIPPAALKPLAIGFAEGFVSDGPELMMCGQLALGDGVNFEQALKDLKHGITHFNITEMEGALKEVKDVIAAIPTAEKTCKTVLADLKNILASLRQIKGPKDLVIHIVDHMFEDSELIFAELAAAEHAYKTGWDYMTAGQQLGMSVRRMAIGEGGDAPSPAPAPPSAKIEMFEGVAVGFVSDNLDFYNCSKDMKHESQDFDQAVKDLEMGVRHLNLTEVKEAVEEFEAFVKGAAPTKATCKAAVSAVERDVKAIVAVLKQIKGPKDLVLKVIDNLFGDGEEIFGDMSTASKSYRVGQYMSSGRDLGMAFRRMLVGKPNMTSNNPSFVV